MEIEGGIDPRLLDVLKQLEKSLLRVDNTFDALDKTLQKTEGSYRELSTVLQTLSKQIDRFDRENRDAARGLQDLQGGADNLKRIADVVQTIDRRAAGTLSQFGRALGTFAIAARSAAVAESAGGTTALVNTINSLSESLSKLDLSTSGKSIKAFVDDFTRFVALTKSVGSADGAQNLVKTQSVINMFIDTLTGVEIVSSRLESVNTAFEQMQRVFQTVQSFSFKDSVRMSINALANFIRAISKLPEDIFELQARVVGSGTEDDFTAIGTLIIAINQIISATENTPLTQRSISAVNAISDYLSAFLRFADLVVNKVDRSMVSGQLIAVFEDIDKIFKRIAGFDDEGQSTRPFDVSQEQFAVRIRALQTITNFLDQFIRLGSKQIDLKLFDPTKSYSENPLILATQQITAFITSIKENFSTQGLDTSSETLQKLSLINKFILDFLKVTRTVETIVLRETPNVDPDKLKDLGSAVLKALVDAYRGLKEEVDKLEDIRDVNRYLRILVAFPNMLIKLDRVMERFNPAQVLQRSNVFFNGMFSVFKAYETKIQELWTTLKATSRAAPLDRIEPIVTNLSSAVGAVVRFSAVISTVPAVTLTPQQIEEQVERLKKSVEPIAKVDEALRPLASTSTGAADIPKLIDNLSYLTSSWEKLKQFLTNLTPIQYDEEKFKAVLGTVRTFVGELRTIAGSLDLPNTPDEKSVSIPKLIEQWTTTLNAVRRLASGLDIDTEDVNFKITQFTEPVKKIIESMSQLLTLSLDSKIADKTQVAASLAAVWRSVTRLVREIPNLGKTDIQKSEDTLKKVNSLIFELYKTFFQKDLRGTLKEYALGKDTTKEVIALSRLVNSYSQVIRTIAQLSKQSLGTIKESDFDEILKVTDSFVKKIGALNKNIVNAVSFDTRRVRESVSIAVSIIQTIPKITDALEAIKTSRSTFVFRALRISGIDAVIRTAAFITRRMADVAGSMKRVNPEKFTALGEATQALGRLGKAIPSLLRTAESLPTNIVSLGLRLVRMTVIYSMIVRSMRPIAKSFSGHRIEEGTKSLARFTQSLSRLLKYSEADFQKLKSLREGLKEVSKLKDTVEAMPKHRGAQPAQWEVVKQSGRYNQALAGMRIATMTFDTALLRLTDSAFKTGAAIFQGIAQPLENLSRTALQTGMTLLRNFNPSRFITSATGQLALEYDDIIKQFKVFAPQTPIDELVKFATEIGVQYPLSINESLNAVLDLSKAGLDFSDVVGVLPTAAQLASVSKTKSIEDATGTLIAAVRGVRMINEEMPTAFTPEAVSKIGDIIFRVANATTATVDSMREGLRDAVPAANNFGQTFEQAAAVLGIFNDAQIDSTRAGYLFRAMLTGIYRKESRKVFEELGIALETPEGKLRALNEIVRELSDVFASLSESERLRYIQRIGDVFAQQGLGILLARRGFDDLLEKTREGQTLAEASNIILESFKGRLLQLKSAFDALRTTVFVPILNEFMLPIVDTLRKIVSAFLELPESVKRSVGQLLVFGSVTTTITGGMLLFGGAVLKVVAVSASLAAVVTSLSLFIKGAVFGLLSYIKVTEKVSDSVSETGEMAERTVTLLEKLTSVIKNLSAENILIALETLKARFYGLSEATGDFINNVNNLFNVDKYQDGSVSLQKLLESFSRVLYELTAVIARRVSFSLIDALAEFDRGNIIAGIREFFSAAIGEALYRLNNEQALVESLLRIVSNLLNPINLPLLITQLLGLDELSNVLSQLRDTFNSLFTGLTASILAGLGNFQMVTIAVRNLGSSGVDLVQFFRGIAAVVSETIGLVVDFAKTVVQALVGVNAALEENTGSPLTRVFRTIGSILEFIAERVIRPLRSFVTSLLPALGQAVRSIQTLLQPLVDFLVLAGATVLSFLSDVANAFRDFFNNELSFESLAERVRQAVSDLARNTIYVAANFIYGLKNAFVTLFSNLGDALNVGINELTVNGTRTILEGIVVSLVGLIGRAAYLLRSAVSGLFDQLSVLFNSESLYYISNFIRTLDLQQLVRGAAGLVVELARAVLQVFEQAIITAFNLLTQSTRVTNNVGRSLSFIAEKALTVVQFAAVLYASKVVFEALIRFLTPIVTSVILAVKAFALSVLAEVSAFGQAVIGVVAKILSVLKAIFLTTLLGRVALFTIVVGALATIAIEMTRVTNAADANTRSVGQFIGSVVEFLRNLATEVITWTVQKLMTLANLVIRVAKMIYDLTTFVVTGLILPFGRVVVTVLRPPLELLVRIIVEIIRLLPTIIAAVGVIKAVAGAAAALGVNLTRVSSLFAGLAAVAARFGGVASRVGLFLSGLFQGVFGRFSLAIVKLYAVITGVNALSNALNTAFSENILSGILEFFLTIGEAVFNALGLGKVVEPARENAEKLKSVMTKAFFYIGQYIETLFNQLAVSLAVFASQVAATFDRLRGLDPTQYDLSLNRANALAVTLKSLQDGGATASERINALQSFLRSLAELEKVSAQDAARIALANRYTLSRELVNFYTNIRSDTEQLQRVGGDAAVNAVAELGLSLSDFRRLLSTAALEVEQKMLLISDAVQASARTGRSLGDSFRFGLSDFLSQLDDAQKQAIASNSAFQQIIVDAANRLVDENIDVLDELKPILEGFNILVSRSRFTTQEAALAVETLKDAVTGLNEAATTKAIEKFRQSLQGLASDSDQASKAVEELTKNIQGDLRAEARELFAQLDESFSEGALDPVGYTNRVRELRKTLLRSANENLKTVQKELFENLSQNKITVETFERGMLENTRSYENAIDEINNLADIALNVTRRLRRGEISQEQAVLEAQRIIEERRRAREEARNKLIAAKSGDLPPPITPPEFLEGAGMAVEDLDKQIKDVEKDVLRLQRDYEKTLQQIARDQEKHLLDLQRAEEDYQRDRERRLEDHQNKLLEIEENSRDQLIEAVNERDSAAAQNAIKNRKKQLEQERKNFAEDQKRREEDYEIQRRRRIEDYEARRAERLQEAAERRAELEARRAELAALQGQQRQIIERETQEKREAAEKAVQIARSMGDKTIGEFTRMARGAVDALASAVPGLDNAVTPFLKALINFAEKMVGKDTSLFDALRGRRTGAPTGVVQGVYEMLQSVLGVNQGSPFSQSLKQLLDSAAPAVQNLANVERQIKDRIAALIGSMTPVRQAADALKNSIVQRVEPALNLSLSITNAVESLVGNLNKSRINLPQAQESVQYLSQLFSTVGDASKRIENTLSQLRSRQITPQQSLTNIVQIVSGAVQSVLDAVGQANAINQLIQRMNDAIRSLPSNIQPVAVPSQRRGTIYPQERWSQFRSGFVVPRAAGGSVLGTRLYRVGEFEPELFRQGNRLYLIPGQNGRIEPPRGLKPRFGSVYNSTSSVQVDLGGITINTPNAVNAQQLAAEVERVVIPKITKAIKDSRV